MGNLGSHSSFAGSSLCHGKSTLGHLLWTNANILGIYNWEFNSFQHVGTFLSLFYSFQEKNIGGGGGGSLLYYKCPFPVVFFNILYIFFIPNFRRG